MRRKTARKAVAPSFLNVSHDCTVCGAKFIVDSRTDIFRVGETKVLGCTCPYCKCDTVMHCDINANFKNKLHEFVVSQVAPIKSIVDESVRLPMMRLLDSFNKLLED